MGKKTNWDALFNISSGFDFSAINEAVKQWGNISESLEPAIKAMTKNYSSITTSGAAELTRSLRQALLPYSELGESYSKILSVISESLPSVQDTFKIDSRASLLEVSKTFQESVQLLSDNIDLEPFKQLQNIDYTNLLHKLSPQTSSLTELANSAYSEIENEALIENDNDIEDDFTEEELQECLEEQFSEPQKFQERFSEWVEEKKKKYYIFYRLVCLLITIFVVPYLQQKVGLPVMTYIECQVKELPQKGAEIIDKLEAGVEAVISEDVNYYYKVIYIDENGEKKEGYVAKRNLKMIEDKTEASNEIDEE